jgi:hypothetical protein
MRADRLLSELLLLQADRLEVKSMNRRVCATASRRKLP